MDITHFVVTSRTLTTRRCLKGRLCLLMRGFTPFTASHSAPVCPDEFKTNWSYLTLHLAKPGQTREPGAKRQREMLHCCVWRRFSYKTGRYSSRRTRGSARCMKPFALVKESLLWSGQKERKERRNASVSIGMNLCRSHEAGSLSTALWHKCRDEPEEANCVVRANKTQQRKLSPSVQCKNLFWSLDKYRDVVDFEPLATKLKLYHFGVQVNIYLTFDKRNKGKTNTIAQI